ncbi:hemerythrin domain-containing protein [Kitasatospora sp. NPDC006697]|uniref:hemerythrin domain-containing protein n=1 Tax=Kitasatospora sp. NPDC006697 TaxID=3364020 RepID=UPI0036B1DE85
MPHNDLLDELTAHHRILRDRASALTGLQLGDPRRRAAADALAGELMRHLRAEEVTLYPLVRRLPGGVEKADLCLSTHASLEALVERLSYRSATAPGFDRLAAQLVELTTGHLGEEEATVFALARTAAPDGELAALGARATWHHAHAATTPKHGGSAMLPPDDFLPPERGPAKRTRDFFRPSSAGYRQPDDLLPAPEGGHIQRIRKHFDRAGDQRQ